MPGAPPKEGKHGAFDATLFTTAEAIAGSGPSLGRRKRPARKRTADLFTDDPTLLAKAGPPRSLATGDEGAGFDDDRDLNVAIAEARKKNIELLRQRQLFSALEEDAEMEDATPRPEAQGSLVISDVSEFLASVKKPGRVKKGEAVAVEPAAREEPGAAAQQPDAAMQTALPSAADEAPPAEFGEEPLVSKGVGATLAFLQMRGMGLRLGTGRAVDSMPAASPFPDIKLVYRDEFGGEISQKEAYKMLSHRFHGKRPGKNKEEKRLQRKTETAKLLGATLGDTPLGSGSLLRKKQAATGTSHIVLARGKTGAKPDQAELNVGGKPPVQKEASTSKKPGPLASAKKPRIFGML